MPTMRFDPLKLSRALAARGIDGERLAALAAIDRSTVSRARRGKAVRPETVGKLVKALHDLPVLPGAEELLA